MKRFFAHRVLAAAVVVVAGCLMACGCSVVSPADDSWEGGYGDVSGTVTNWQGAPLADITVSMWAEVGIEASEVLYETTTDATGCFSVPNVDLGGKHAFAETYEVYVNCTKSNRAAVNAEYQTYIGTTVIEQGQDCVLSVVLPAAGDDPGDPSSMFE